MVWIILYLLGLPLWFVLFGLVTTIVRNKKLRARPGNFTGRMRWPGKPRWSRGNGIWVSDVLVFRKSPIAWFEEILHVTAVTMREPTAEEAHKLRKLGDGIQIATLTTVDGQVYEAVADAEHRSELVGPFATAAIQDGSAG